MNRQLAESDVPFGTVAASLGFTREPIASARRGDPGCPVRAISTHRALLRLAEGQPLALVVNATPKRTYGAETDPRSTAPLSTTSVITTFAVCGCG